MPSELWNAVDRYVCDQLVPPDPVLEAALAESAAAGLPAISVTPNQGKLLALLVQLSSARTVLEVGTLGGYSTIWLARAMGTGDRLITLEVDAHHAAVARGNIARAGLSEIVAVRLGAALDTLPRLAAEGAGPFDLTFIDADKANNASTSSGAPALPARERDRGRQRCARGSGSRRRQYRPCRPGHPSSLRGDGRRTPGERHRDPNRGHQGLRRIWPWLSSRARASGSRSIASSGDTPDCAAGRGRTTSARMRREVIPGVPGRMLRLR